MAQVQYHILEYMEISRITAGMSMEYEWQIYMSMYLNAFIDLSLLLITLYFFGVVFSADNIHLQHAANV